MDFTVLNEEALVSYFQPFSIDDQQMHSTSLPDLDLQDSSTYDMNQSFLDYILQPSSTTHIENMLSQDESSLQTSSNYMSELNHPQKTSTLQCFSKKEDCQPSYVNDKDHELMNIISQTSSDKKINLKEQDKQNSTLQSVSKKKESPPSKFNICNICNKTFSRFGALKRHWKIHTGEKNYSCDVCNKTFHRRDTLTHHLKVHAKSYTCVHCNKIFREKTELAQHVHNQHTIRREAKISKRRKVYPTSKRKYQDRKSNYLKSRKSCIISTFKSNHVNDFHEFFTSLKPFILRELNRELEENSDFKWHIRVKTLFTHKRTVRSKVFSADFISMKKDNLAMNIQWAFNDIMMSYQGFITKESKWKIVKILKLYLCTTKLLSDV